MFLLHPFLGVIPWQSWRGSNQALFLFSLLISSYVFSADAAAAASATNTLLDEAQKVGGGDEPRQGAGAGESVSKMSEVFERNTFGKALQSKSQKLKGRQYDGQPIYKVTEKGVSKHIDKGDHLYLDGAHKDHLEVFDSHGRFKTVLNLDGGVNDKKVAAIWKKGGRDIGHLL